MVLTMPSDNCLVVDNGHLKFSKVIALERLIDTSETPFGTIRFLGFAKLVRTVMMAKNWERNSHPSFQLSLIQPKQRSRKIK